MNYVYLLRCADGTLYCGWTTDLAARVKTHNSGKGAKYTRSRLPVEFRREGVPRALRNDAQLTIFRVLQEALNNARKHAEAKQIRVELVFGESMLRLTIADDGKGFDASVPKRGHYGITTMRERASKIGGTAEIDTAPGKGTRIALELPYVPSSAEP